ncbi:MAG TPA: hypothetical protein VF060_23565 [Trebonia sp.]
MSTRTASPARNAASASSTDQPPRSPAKWLNVPAGITSSGRPASSATAHAAVAARHPEDPRFACRPAQLLREGLPGVRFDAHGARQLRS